MKKLLFQNYSFASLPSGTYLFFPLSSGAEAGARPARAGDPGELAAEPSRLVVSTLYDGGSELVHSGVAAGSSVYVTLATAAFDELLKRLQDPTRNLRQKPIQFGIEIDEEETVKQFEIDGVRLQQAPVSDSRTTGRAAE